MSPSERISLTPVFEEVLEESEDKSGPSEKRESLSEAESDVLELHNGREPDDEKELNELNELIELMEPRRCCATC